MKLTTPGCKKAGLLLLAVITAGGLFLMTALPVRAQTPSIDITAPADITEWVLTPAGEQPITQAGTLLVTTTDADGKNWSVAASDADITNTIGYMTRYRDIYTTGMKLHTAMQVQGPVLDAVTLPVSGNVVTGTGTVTKAEYTITFQQTVLWSDAVITSPDCYRIVVTFTGSITP